MQEMVPLYETATEKPPKKKWGSMQILLIQTVCCAVLVGLFYLFRVFGGSAYTELRTAFQKALENNSIMETVATVFREETPDSSYTVENNTTVTTAPTTTTTATP